MKRQYAVIGLGKFGYSVARTFVKCDCEVIAWESTGLSSLKGTWL